MTAPDFARCPSRTAKCPAPAYCHATCRHAAAWLRGLGAQPEPARPAEVEDDGFVTAHCTGGWE